MDFSKISPIALYQAASNGHENTVRILLAGNAEAYVGDTTTGLTPLQIAAENGHLQVVRTLCTVPPQRLSPGRSMDAPHEITGMKASHYAAVKGHDEIVTLLLKHGSGCDDRDALGETALIKAAKSEQPVVAKALLEGGADPLVRGGKYSDLRNDASQEWPQKSIAVHHAAANGHDNVLTILPYSDLTCGGTEISALHLAAANGHAKVVEILLSKGAIIEIRDLHGWTALHYASSEGHILVVQLLLGRGSKVDLIIDTEYTALHLAAAAAKVETIKLLVAHCAAITAKTSVGHTALHIAAYEADADTLRTLVECGAPLEAKSKGDWTALDMATFSDKPANVLALIELGAEWIRNDVFFRAVEKRNCDLIVVLLGRLSTATAKEQKDAATVIQEVVNKPSRAANKQAVQILNDVKIRVPSHVSAMTFAHVGNITQTLWGHTVTDIPQESSEIE